MAYYKSQAESTWVHVTCSHSFNIGYRLFQNGTWKNSNWSMCTIGVSIFLSIFKVSKLKKFKCYLNLIMGFPGGSVVKNPPTSVWRCWFNLWSGKSGASLVAQKFKRLPAMQEICVRSLGGEDPLEKGMATHSSILAWRIHGERILIGYSYFTSLGKISWRRKWQPAAIIF